MKKIITTTLQIAVTLFALYWVFRKPETRAGLAATLRVASIPWLLAALALSVIAPVAAVTRWWLLLRVQDPTTRFAKILQLFLIGSFFNLFLPGSTSGDAVKVIYLLRGAPKERRAGIILSVLMDRLLGLLALIIMATIFLALRYQWLTQTQETANLVNGFTVILFGAGGVIAAVFVSVQLRLADRLPETLPGRTKFIELASAVRLYTRAWQTTLAGICISVVGHSSLFVSFYLVGVALKAGVRFADMVVLMPIVNTIVSLPISVSGAGVREKLFSTLLGKLCGVPSGTAVTISLMGFLFTVVFSGLVGGVVYVFYRSSAGPLPADADAVEARAEADALPDMLKEATGPVA